MDDFKRNVVNAWLFQSRTTAPLGGGGVA